MSSKRSIDPTVKNLLRNRGKDNFFYSRIEHELLKEAEEDTLKYEWTGRISPSSLFFSMCPYLYIKEATTKEKTTPNSKSLRKMNIGKVMHYLFSKAAADTEGVLWVDPILPPELVDKYKKSYPEVPVTYKRNDKVIISGRVDLVLNIKGSPVIVDLKFPQSTQDIWLKTLHAELPEENYLTQVCIYAALANNSKYYLKKVETVGVLYYNPIVDSAKVCQYKEVYVDYLQYEEKTELLISHLIKEWEANLNKEESECTYKGCKTHGQRTTSQP